MSERAEMLPSEISQRRAICPEAQILLDAFLTAIREIGELTAQQVEAAASGDEDFQRFDLLLHFAGEKKHNAKYALIQHVEQHACLPQLSGFQL
jgi:hypothetical protein